MITLDNQRGFAAWKPVVYLKTNFQAPCDLTYGLLKTIHDNVFSKVVKDYLFEATVEAIPDKVESLSEYLDECEDLTDQKASVEKIGGNSFGTMAVAGDFSLNQPNQKAPVQITGGNNFTTMDSVGNFSAVVRTLNDAYTVNPFAVVAAPITPAEYSAEGATTLGSVVTGPLKALDSLGEIREAKGDGDAQGVAFGRARFAYSAFQGVGGVSVGFMRAAGVAEGFHYTAPALTQSSIVGGHIATPAWGGFYLFAAMLGGGYFRISRNFCNEWKGKKDFAAKIEMIKERLKGNTEDCKEYDKEAIRYVAKLLQNNCRELVALGKPAGLSDDEWNKLVKMADNTSKKAWKELAAKRLYACSDLDSENAFLSQLGLGEVKECGEFIKEIGAQGFSERQAQVNENALRRAIGSKAVEAFKNAEKTDLLARLEKKEASAQEEARVLCETIEAAANKGYRMNLLGTTMCVVLLVPSILGYIFQDPLSLFILTVSNLVGYLMMTYFDYVNWIDDLNADGPVGKNDRRNLMRFMAFAVVMSAIGIGLSVLSGGILPIAVSVLMGAVWIGVLLYSHYSLGLKDERYKLEHPTLQKLEELLNKEGTLDEAKEILRKLPTVQREQILKALFEGLEDEKSESLGNILNFKPMGETPAAIGKEFSETYENDPLINRAMIALYEKLGSPEMDEEEDKVKFYEAIYDQIELELSEIMIKQLRKAIEETHVEGQENVLKTTESIGKVPGAWDNWTELFTG